MSAGFCSKPRRRGASVAGGRPALRARLLTVDRCRRGGVRPDLAGGQKASVQAGPRCLRGGAKPSGPGRKWPGPGPGERREGTTRMSTTQDYQAAEQLLRRPARPGELVIGDKVRPQWIDGGARFWYAVSNGAGRRFVLVDPAAGTREPAFDHARLAAALAAASGQQVDPEALPFMAI